jgi:hypothetical protein
VPFTHHLKNLFWTRVLLDRPFGAHLRTPQDSALPAFEHSRGGRGAAA